jgi:AcrR family transcriptional regulator
MPRPRFEKLEPARRAAILAVASEEFALHGYEGASYNRIIERSGLSKGALYYYFDDKEDLYVTVLRDALRRLVFEVADLGAACDVAGFWREFEAWYVRSLRLFQQDPSAVGLARSLVKVAASGTAGGVMADLRRLTRGWVDEFIGQGQALGAVRCDLPADLLAAALAGLEEGIDLWLGERLGDMGEAEICATAAMLTGFYRQIVAPPQGAEGALAGGAGQAVGGASKVEAKQAPAGAPSAETKRAPAGAPKAGSKRAPEGAPKAGAKRAPGRMSKAEAKNRR